MNLSKHCSFVSLSVTGKIQTENHKLQSPNLGYTTVLCLVGEGGISFLNNLQTKIDC